MRLCFLLNANYLWDCLRFFLLYTLTFYQMIIVVLDYVNTFQSSGTDCQQQLLLNLNVCRIPINFPTLTHKIHAAEGYWEGLLALENGLPPAWHVDLVASCNWIGANSCHFKSIGHAELCFLIALQYMIEIVLPRPCSLLSRKVRLTEFKINLNLFFLLRDNVTRTPSGLVKEIV